MKHKVYSLRRKRAPGKVPTEPRLVLKAVKRNGMKEVVPSG